MIHGRRYSGSWGGGDCAGTCSMGVIWMIWGRRYSGAGSWGGGDCAGTFKSAIMGVIWMMCGRRYSAAGSEIKLNLCTHSAVHSYQV